MIGIRLSLQSGVYDMLMTAGAFEMAEDGTAAAGFVFTRLSTSRNECEDSGIVDTVRVPNRGTDYYGIIFDATKSRAAKELEMKRVVLSTPGVLRILEWSWEQTDRSVNISGVVKTQWGDYSFSQLVTPL